MTRTDKRLFPILFAALAVLALAVGLLTMPGWPVHAQDGAAPAKPTGLTAQVSYDQVTLTWDALNDDSITGYIILRRDKAVHEEGIFETVEDDTESADTTYTDNTVERGKTYVYRIKAVNEHGVSEISSWVRAYTVPAKPRTLTAPVVAHDSVTLTWRDPQDDSITGYVILRRDKAIHAEGIFKTVEDNTGSAATTYTDDTVEPDKQYVYRIKAINAAGLSEISSWVRAYTPAAPEPAPEPVNSAPTGAPTISGTAQVGETLTSDTNGIADENGLENVAFTHQWLAADTAIQGATASTYTLVDTDEGKAIKVRVSFTDDEGNGETLTSAATAAVAAAPNSPATGSPAITGAAQVAETLTVDASGIGDEDGLEDATFSYQWLADGTVIQGATANAYTPVEADEGKAVTVQVNFTDDAGNDETLTSAPTAAVAAAQPTEPPAKPADLSATASHDRVVLTWKDPNDDSITGYVILRRIRVNDQSGDFTELVADTGSAATTYTDNNVAASTTYTYRIKAINAAGTSERSRWVHVDTPADPAAELPATPPEAPKLPTNATTYHVEGGRNWVTFRWERPEGDVDGYRVLRIRHSRMESRHRVVKVIDDPDVTEFEDPDVVEGSDFGWAVQAYNGAGFSDKSEHECGRLDSVYTEGSLGLAYPGDAQATFVEDDGDPGVLLEWSEPTEGYHGGEVSPATGYQILRWDINHGFPDWDLLVENTGSTATSFIDRSILPNSQYSYQVRAWNDWGVGERSFQANVRTTEWDVPGAPRNLTVTHVDGGIQLQWNHPDDTDGEDTLYRIYRRENSGGVEPLQLLEAGYDDLQYVDNDVVDGVHYHYQVRVDGGDDVTAHGMLSRLVASGWD